MNVVSPPSRFGSQKGMAATLLVVIIVVLLSALTAVNISTVRRARREADLLDARHQRQWQRRGAIPATPPTSTPRPPANPG